MAQYVKHAIDQMEYTQILNAIEGSESRHILHRGTIEQRDFIINGRTNLCF